MRQYRFTFERNKLIMLLGGAVLAGLLTFAAGILTGLALEAPSRSEIAMLKSQHLAQQAAAKAASDSPAQPPVQPAAQTAALVAPPQVQAQAPPVIAAPVVAPAIQTTAAPPAAVADVSSASSLGTAIPTEKDLFSLQIGAFPDAKAARELQAELRERGYPAAIFTGVDAERKEWHTVRIGGFATLAKATAAASAFTGKERLQALIRPSNNL